MAGFPSGNPDPRLLASQAMAKAKDLEARMANIVGGLNAVPPSLMYTTTQTIVTQTTNGSYTWTCPAGVTSAYIESWGAGSGGGGGGASRGGEGGGGGEYGAEPAYPLVPGTTYNYVVGQGGTGGTTGYGGQGGTSTIFDTNGYGLSYGVFANGGQAGSGFTGGAGGGVYASPDFQAPSPNTLQRSGGSGGGNASQGSGGCGGGGSGGPTTGGTGGATSGSSTGASGGVAGGSPGGAGGSGGNSAANGSNGSSPGGGGGGAGASSSASTGQSTYRMSQSGTYYGSDASGGNANGFRGSGTMYQGGETASGGSYNGTQKALAIISGSPASDLSGKTIDQVTIRLEWLHTWYNNGAYVILGYTPFTSFGSTWGGGSITSVKTWWQGNVGSPITTDLTNQGFGTALANGNAKSISLGPGSPGYDLYNYGYMYGAGGDNNQNPLITVNWHSGSAPVQAGNGADGEVRITYTNPTGQTLVAALQPSAGTDTGNASGNAFALGYTGPVQAIHPGSNPSTVEAWQTISNPSGWSGYIRVRLVAELNMAFLDFALTHTALSSKTNVTISSSWPSAYRPSSAQTLPLQETNNTAVASPLPSLYIGPGGTVTAYYIDTGTTQIDCHAAYYLA